MTKLSKNVFLDGWVDGWMGGQKESKAVFRIVYSNQNFFNCYNILFYTLFFTCELVEDGPGPASLDGRALAS